MKRLAVLVASIAFALADGGAAADATDACIDAHEQAQKLRKDGHLQEARKALLSCAVDGCPQLVAADCRVWLEAANEEQPSIVVAVRDESGAETSEARVFIDDILVADRLDGRPIEVDPGDHRVRVVRATSETSEQKIFVRVREKEKLVQFSFARPAAPTPNAATDVGERKSVFTPAVVVLGAVGIAALGTSLGTLIVGKSKESNLSGSGCKPNCDPAKIDEIRTQYWISGISLGVGVVAIGVATLLAAQSPNDAPTASATAFSFDVHPTFGGATLSLDGRF